jgi:taurine--2-oxoglutarate transaminase
MKNGVYISPWTSTLVIAPPVIITEAQIDEAISVLDKALEIGDKNAIETGVPVSRSCEYKR